VGTRILNSTGGIGHNGSADWAAFNPAMTRAQWESNTGASLLQYLDFRDASSLTIGAANAVTAATDKSSNARNPTIPGTATLVNLGTRNALQLSSDSCLHSSSLGGAITGTVIATPHQVGVVIRRTGTPSAAEYLWCEGRATTSSTRRGLYINTSNQICYEYVTDGGATETFTSTDTVPLNTDVQIWTHFQRTRLIVWMHDGSTYIMKRILVGCAGINSACTFSHFVWGAKHTMGSLSNRFTSGYILGGLVPSHIIDTYACMFNTASMFGLSTTGAANVSTLHTGLLSHIVFNAPAATTTAGDACDLINGTILAAVGTPATDAGGVYGRTFNQTADANRFTAGSNIVAAQDFYNKSTFHMRIVFTPTEVSSHRTIFQMGTSPYAKVVHTGGKANINFNGTSVSSTASVVNGTLYYLDIWANNSLTVNMSLNGETPVTVTRASYQSMVGLSLYLAATPVPGNYYRGRIDEITMWDRVLDSTEKTALTNGGAHRHGFKQYIAAEA